MAIRKKRSMASRLSAQRYKKPKIKTVGMESDMGKAFPISEIKIKKTQEDGNDVNFAASTEGLGLVLLCRQQMITSDRPLIHMLYH